MTRLERLLCIFAVLAMRVPGQETNCSPGPHTLYSRKATGLDGAMDTNVLIMSPDHKKELVVKAEEDSRDPDGIHINYTVRISGKAFRTKLLGFNGEVAWSPDSKAFSVTQTEGGGSIGSRVYVFYVGENGTKKLDVSLPIEKAFGHPVKCEVKVPPNTGFIRWGANSSTILVAAEVIPVSICTCMGTFRVYEIALPSVAIVHSYSQTEAKKRFWGDLGCELRTADDECVSAVERYARKRGDR